MSILVTQSSMPDMNEYIDEIAPIFESKWLTNMGQVYKKFQHQLIDYLGVRHISLFANGHLALEMALQTMSFPAGSEVITTPFTFVSTTHAISRNNLVPVFCDIKSDDYTIDPEKIESLITDKTVAIVPVHVYGSICDVEKIQQIANKHNLKVIYDGAHAFGVKYKGIGIGNYGDMTMFSFHATKVFNTIEGGAVTFSNEEYRMRLHQLKNFGIHREDCITDIGGNAKLDEFRAAMGICNLRHIDENINKRKKVFECYVKHLGNIPGVKLLTKQENVEQNYAYFPVYFDKEVFGKNRDEIYDLLKKNDISARRYFYPAVNELECYSALVENKNDTPVAHNVTMNVLCLPMYADLSLEDVDMICRIILY